MRQDCDRTPVARVLNWLFAQDPGGHSQLRPILCLAPDALASRNGPPLDDPGVNRYAGAALARKDALIAELNEQRWLLIDERRTLRRRVEALERLLRAHDIPFNYTEEPLVSVRPDPRD